MKKYCKDCKFNRSGYGVEFNTCKPWLEKPKRGKVIVDDFYAKEHVVRTTAPEPAIHWMRELNKENDCKYHRRKWWKFWVPK